MVDTYKATIRRWLIWCRMMGVGPGTPRGWDLSGFLDFLFNKEELASSTVLVDRVAVITFCSRDPSDLPGEFLLKQVLKDIEVSRPRDIQASIWDEKFWFNWLGAKTAISSFFEVSWRAASLLLLASGHRRHDLMSLKISKQFLTNFGKKVIIVSL